jgi:predicted RNA-binding protein with PUA-like domain
MNYWIIKSEPDEFSIWDLENNENQRENWDGVRNYQVRNMIRDDIKVGDLCLFYHSSCKNIGIAGICEVTKENLVDGSAFDKKSDYYDPKSTLENPRWRSFEVKWKESFKRLISLKELKEHQDLQELLILKRGNRLSITPLSKNEFKTILKLKA